MAGEHEPRLITSWEAFTQAFGDLQFGNLVLAHAVYGFFNNGGGRCWVTRVAAPAPNGDHPDAPDVDAVAPSAVTAALDGFKAIDEIAIVAVPGATSDAVQNAVLDHCENQHLQDRFAILDGRRTTDATREAVQGGTRDSSYAAIYHPWLAVYDPVSNASLTVPPSGHVAGHLRAGRHRTRRAQGPGERGDPRRAGRGDRGQPGGPGGPQPRRHQRHPPVRRRT